MEIYVLTGIVLFIGSILHSAAGFGFALFAIPVLLLLGLQPYEAIALTAVSVIVHGTLSVGRSQTKPQWGEIVLLVAIACALQPLGAWLLGRIIFLDRGTVGQIYGAILLAVLALQAWLRPVPQERLHPAWGVITMVASGVISGLSGMGGPPIVLWLMAHKWSNERIRVTLWTIFSMLALTNLFWLQLRFGTPVMRAALLGLLFAPLTLLGTWPGSWVGNRMSSKVLRQAATALLLLIAAYAILQPVLLPGLASGGK